MFTRIRSLLQLAWFHHSLPAVGYGEQFSRGFYGWHVVEVPAGMRILVVDAGAA